MSLLKKFLGAGRGAPDTQPPSSPFHESETAAQHRNNRNAPRRELVHVVLRDTMRKHGIPSDWIDCRILSAVTRADNVGMHVHFIVAGKGQSRLIAYVQAFQESFWEEIEKFDPRARDWLLSLAWQFDSSASQGAGRSMPKPGEWHEKDGETPPADADDGLEADLKALYAIRDAALAPPAGAAPSPFAPQPAREAKGDGGSR